MMLIGGCIGGYNHKFKVTHDLGKEIKLRGTILKPKREGSFPAVVLLHDCGGINSCDYTWASKLVK